MSQVAHLKSPENRVFLWTVPRSLSTIFLKCICYVPNINLQVINEPYVSVFYYGPDRKSKNNLIEDKFESAFQQAGNQVPEYNVYDDSLSTYKWVRELLEADYAGKDMVLCKDHAYCFNGKYDLLPKGYKHTFIIRHPYKTLPSLMKVTESICSVDFTQIESKDFPEPMHQGYQKLYELVEYVKSTGEPHPIIIDADDLQKNPESIVKQYCQAVGKYI